jgi:hypothetical protein
MYGQLYQSIVASAQDRDGFAGGTSSGGAVIVAFLAILLVIVIQLFVVRWLWNTVAVKVLAIARPLPDLWYTLGFLVLIAMVHPGYVSTTTTTV